MTEIRSQDFRDRLERDGADWRERRDKQVVASYDDPDRSYRAVRNGGGVALADLSERETLVFEGDDAIPWLQGLVTGDLRELVDLGAGQRNLATNVNGRVVGDFRLLHLPDMLVADLEPGSLQGDGLLSHLRQQIIMEDVTLRDRTEQTGRFGLFGDRAAALLESVTDWRDAPENLTPLEGTWGRIAGREVYLQAVRWTGEPGFQLSFPREASLAIWERLSEAGADALVPIGDDSLETLRIEAGVPRWGVELHDEIIPLEAELRELISFDKGCYLGQEIVVRLDHQGTPAKKLRTLVFDGGAAPRPGVEVEADGREVGTVESAVWSPLAEGPIALAYVKRRHNDFGTTVTVEGRDAVVEPLGHPIDASDAARRPAGT